MEPEVTVTRSQQRRKDSQPMRNLRTKSYTLVPFERHWTEPTVKGTQTRLPPSRISPDKGPDHEFSLHEADELRNARMMVNYGHGDVRDEPDPLHEAAANEIERLRTALHDLAMIFASRPDIYALTGFAERPVIERARKLVNRE